MENIKIVIGTIELEKVVNTKRRTKFRILNVDDLEILNTTDDLHGFLL